MSEEEEKAIERLKYINMAYDCNNYYSIYDLDCIETVLQLLEQKDNNISELEECLKYSNKSVNELQEENTDYRYKLNMLKDDLKETIKEEREFMKDLEHKNVAFHYANGRETLAKEILKILEK